MLGDLEVDYMVNLRAGDHIKLKASEFPKIIGLGITIKLIGLLNEQDGLYRCEIC